MTPVGIFLLTVLSFTYLATFPIFAQETSVTPTPTAASSPTPKPKTSLTPTPSTGVSLNTTPTVTPKLTQTVETTTPTPKQSPEPTSTPAPSPTEAPGPIFAQSDESITTPTPTPQPVVLSHTFQPVLPLGRIITAPFDLVTNYLPKNYYDDQGLTPQTNNLLLILAFLCISVGTGLLQWPTILKAKHHIFASSKKTHEFPIYSQKN